MQNIIYDYPRQEDKIRKRKQDDIFYIILHHTVMDDEPIDADVYKLIKYFSSENNHITPGKSLPCFAYHEVMEVVDNKITFFETAHPTDITYHAGAWNSESYSISINQMDYDELTIEQYKMLVIRLAELCIQLNISPIFIRGHRELKGTGWYIRNKKFGLRKTCPGFINMSVLRQEVVEQLRQKGFLRVGVYNLENYGEQYIDKNFIKGVPMWDRKVFGGIVTDGS